VLFQDQFSLVDLNYDKIKKGRLIPVSVVGGPSLKLMELNRRVQTLQMEYQSAKQKGSCWVMQSRKTRVPC
jgi:hypothetical protein